MKMRTFLLVGGLVFVSLFIVCGQAQEPAPQRIPDRPWQVECKGEHCYLSITAKVQDQKGDDEEVIVVVDVLAADKTAKAVQVILPPDVSKELEITIKFIDTVRDGTSFKLVDAGGMYALPINNCHKEACASIVHPLLDNGDGTKLDLFQQLKKHDFVWLLFQRKEEKEPSRAVVPTYNFRDAVVKIGSNLLDK